MLRRADWTPPLADVGEAFRSSKRELTLVATVVVWIAFGAGLDSSAGIWRQRLVGLLTWSLLLAILSRQPRSVRAQVAVVIVIATCVEYTASPLLGLYTYRLHNVPSYVPPGHGLVYLAALNIGRSALAERLRFPLLTFASSAAARGRSGAPCSRPARICWAPSCTCSCSGSSSSGASRSSTPAAFLVCSYLELVGTGVGAWRWALHDPTGVLTIGNPPSGIPGGYCFLDAFGLDARAARAGADRPAPIRLPAPAPASR